MNRLKIRTMKIVGICLAAMLLCAPRVLSAQETRITIEVKNVSLQQLLTEIEKKAGVRFSYLDATLDTAPDITIRAKNETVEAILSKVLASKNLSYAITGNTIAISAAPSQAMQPPQSKTVTGTVTDDNGAPLPGVNVVVKGSTTGTVTNAEGKYTIAVPNEQAVLQFSFVGYEPQEIVVGQDVNISASLKEGQQIEEVVVVGYGTQKKVNLTGAVASVGGDAIAKRQVGQTSLALQGAMPGVTVTQRSGQPGADGGSIRIRGIGTLNNSDPLVLVDGIEMGINDIDVNTIESISVLKDAASASIYGSKAANGVILVTTKRAQQGKFNIAYSGYVAWQSPTDLPDKVDAIDHITLLNESKVNSNAGAVYTPEQIEAWKTLGPNDRDHYPDTDWQKEVLNGNGFQQNHNLTLTGGTEKLRILASLGYMKQNGIVKPVDYQRISLRINTDIKFSDQFSSSLDLYLYNSNRNSVAQYSGNSSNSSGIGFIFYTMNKFPAVQAAKYSNGTYGEGQNGENPVNVLDNGGYYTVMQTPMVGNFSFKWTPSKDFWMQATFAPSISYPQTKSYVKRTTTHNADGSVFSTLPAKASLTMTQDYSRDLQFRTTANYKKAFGLHNIALMGGFQYESYYSSWFNAFRDDFLFPDYSQLNSGSVENMQNGGSAGENSLISWFGRLNYDFKNKYLFEANIRYDGSSKFAKGKQWGAFPSFSAGWRISEEAFWDGLRNYVNHFKIRGSWGTLGNQNIGSNYPFSSNIDLSSKYISEDKLVDGAALITINNPDITWETTTMTDVGVDLNLFNKLDLTFDWYYKKTTDILMTLDIPATVGLNPTFQNAGTVENKGYDINLTYRDHAGDFNFDVTFNFSDVRNKILDLKGINGTGLVTNREGHEINSLYGRHCLGILTDADFNADGSYKWIRQGRTDLAPGDLRYANLKDAEGVTSDADRLVNADDQQVMGSTIPRYTFGLNFTGRYKGFDLGILLQGVAKVDGYMSSIAYPFYSGGTAFEMHKDRWTTENQNTGATFPRLYFFDTVNNYASSDWYVKSAAYLRVKNLQIGYTIPKKISQKVMMDYFRIYLSGENILTIDKFWDGWDPEVSPGSGGNYYPQIKTLSVGMDIRF